MHRRRYSLLLTYLLLALPFIGYGAWQSMEIQASSPIDWVPESFPARRDYDRFRESFGAGDALVIGWPGCTIDEPNVDKVARVLRTAKGFHTVGGEWFFERVTTGREIVSRMTSPPLSLSRADAVKRLSGSFVGPDGETTCIIVTFTADGLKERRSLVALIRRALKDFADVAPADVHLAGPVNDGLAVETAGSRSLNRFALPSAAIILYSCWWCLRSIRAAFLVFGLSVLAQGVTLALIHFCGGSMTALLIVMPPLIQVLAVAGGIHLVNYYFDSAREPGVKNPAVRAIQLGWLPCVLSAGTTAVGLGSLIVSELTPIRAFGTYAAAGVALTCGLLLAFVPAFFTLWPKEIKAGNDDHSRDASEATERRGWRRLMEVVSRRHRLITAVAVFAMVGAGLGVARMSTSVRIETLFADDSEVLADYRWFEEHIGPLVPIEVVLRFDENSTLSFRERLKLAWRVERKLAGLEQVDAVMSPVTFVPPVPGRDQLPPDVYSQHVAAALEQTRPGLVDLNYLRLPQDSEQLRVTAFVNALDPVDYGEFLDVVRGQVDPLLTDDRGVPLIGASARYTGVMPLVHAIQRQLMTDLFKSFLAAFVLIAVVMTIVQGGVAAGLVSMVSNVFPALLMFGVLGWIGLPMDIGSVTTASVALGIAVDDTLHYLTFFRRGLDAGKSAKEAVLDAYRHCGSAMIQTSLTCGFGLLVFALSDFIPTSRFAWMMLGLLMTALLGDLLVLPALLLGPLGRLFETADMEEEGRESTDVLTTTAARERRASFQEAAQSVAAVQRSAAM